MEAVKPITKCYCNVLALEKGLDPAGSAGDFADAIIVEVPLPWNLNIYQKAGALPQEIIDLLNLWLQRYQAGQGYPHLPLLVAPDRQYSRPGLRRVMAYTRPDGAFSAYHKREYLVPEQQMGALIWALYEAPENLPQFEIYRDLANDMTRDLLICTHGTVDAACAKFGYPLYNDLRQNQAADNLRVWRVSHFGGHVFAPTLMDMPTGHYWAYVERPQAEQIAQRSGDVHTLYGHYRGWAGLEAGFLQAAERELWLRYGWDWFGWQKAGHVITAGSEHENAQWAEVQINFTSADGTTAGCYTAWVEVHRRVSTPHSTASSEPYSYQQYRVIGLQPV